MALLCHTPPPCDVFTLCRVRAAPLPQDCSRQDHSSFLVSPVSLARGGTYRCYVSSSQRPCLLSPPSDPLELSVTGELGSGRCAFASVQGCLEAFRSAPHMVWWWHTSPCPSCGHCVWFLDAEQLHIHCDNLGQI